MTVSTQLNEKKAHTWSLIQDGQFEVGRKIASKLCKANKHDPQCWYLLSLANSQLRNYPEAIKGYQKALKLAPDFVEAAFNLALTYQLSGLISEAIRNFRKTISLKPSLSDAHYGLGNCFYGLGQYTQAAEAYKTALAHRPDFINAKINLGLVLYNLGELDSAESILSSAVKQGNSAAAHLHLGRLHQTRGENQKAFDSYNSALAIEPTSATIWAQISNLYESTGQLDFAKKACGKAIEYDPDLIEAHHRLGAIYFQTSDMPKSQQHFENVLALNSKHADALVGIGSIKVSQGHYEEGLEYTNRAIDSDSSNSNAVVLKAKIYEQMGKLDEALETLQPIVDENIVNAAAGSVYANICHSKKQYHDGTRYLEKLLTHNNLSNWERQQIHFALGKLYDASGKYDDAFSHYQKANNLRFCRYSPEHETTYTDKIVKIFSRNYTEKIASSTRTAERPVFIVGMPRSGTSLVEQILSRHPEVTGGGELIFIHDLARDMQGNAGHNERYPDCLEQMTAGDLDKLADEYLKNTSELHSDNTLLTDKLPANFQHLGLISLLFPSAIIIHCKRNPIDTCLSCYFQDFVGDLGFSYNLEHLAHYYTEYRRLMQHWENTLSIPMLTLNYEDLVQEQELKSRELVAFCGLEWDPQCLEFSTSSRFVRTASYDQVRRPIYNSSVERWKYYQDHITPLLQLIEQE